MQITQQKVILAMGEWNKRFWFGVLVLVPTVLWAEGNDYAELQNLVIQDCGSCHGLTLKGGLGPALHPRNLETLPAAAVAAIIREGVPGTAMPPWKALLTDHEIRWISEQLKSGALITPQSRPEAAR